MKKIMLFAVALSFVQVAGAGVDFDRGVDIRNAIDTAVNSEAAVPAAKFGVPTYISRDCKNITFTAEDSLTSAQVPLFSQETGQDCQNMGYPVGQICWPTSQSYRANAQIIITEPRALEPGQKEVFEVCLWGSFLSLKPVSTPYKYSVNQVFDVFRLTPQGPARAGVAKADAQDICTLVMDSSYSCIYQCKDGSYISKPNFGPPPFPGMDFPFHGCPGSVPNTPLITITK